MNVVDNCGDSDTVGTIEIVRRYAVESKISVESRYILRELAPIGGSGVIAWQRLTQLFNSATEGTKHKPLTSFLS